MNIETVIQSVESQDLRQLLAQMHNQIVDLQEEVRSLRRQIFARKSEQMRPADPVIPKGSLFDEAEAIASRAEESADAAAECPHPTASKQTGVVKKPSERKPRQFAPHHERRRVVHDLPADRQICSCGCTMEKIGEEVVEKLGIEVAKVFVSQHIYNKYACKGCQTHVEQAKAEPSPLPGGSFDLSIIAWVLGSKFGLGLPLYRLEGELKSFGAEVTRLTLSRMVIRTASFLMPLYDHLRSVIMSSSVVCADETRLQVLRGKKKSDSDSFMWVVCSGPFQPAAALFMYDPSRSGDAAQRLLKGFQGQAVVADGYAGYNAFFAKNQDVSQAGCWAHARRKFEDALQSCVTKGFTDRAKTFLDHINQLFLLERDLADLTAEERLRERKINAPPIIQELRLLLDQELFKTLPSGKLGRALVYLQRQWEPLQTFLKYGDVPLSNNHCENMIRPFVMGRKAWLFSASEPGAESSAVLYSLAVSARQHDLNTEFYFRRVLTQLVDDKAAGVPTDFEALMPWSIKAAVTSQIH